MDCYYVGSAGMETLLRTPIMSGYPSPANTPPKRKSVTRLPAIDTAQKELDEATNRVLEVSCNVIGV